MNRLTTKDRVRIIRCLVEGNSVRSTCRITGFAKGTVLKLLCDMGTACAEMHHECVHGLHTERLQCDEIWSFVAMKQKNVPAEQKEQGDIGDVWTWTALDADSKFMVSWLVGDRTNASAFAIMADCADRIVSERVQITSDGYRFYHNAVAEAFTDDVDYAELHKKYGGADDSPNARYSPKVCIGCIRKHIRGNPDPAHISTSYVERANWTMRMGMRRFTRLTNGFSKKLDNHSAAIALHFAYYNWCRSHQSIGTSPAKAAGLTDHVWSLDELVAELEAKERSVIGTEANKRGSYAKKANAHTAGSK